MFKKIVILIFLTTLLSSCAVHFGQRFQEHKVEGDSSVLYVFRGLTLLGAAATDHPVIFFDGTEIGPMKIGGYYEILTDPGEHVIDLIKPKENKKEHIVINLVRGESKYLEYDEDIKYLIPLSSHILMGTSEDFSKVSNQKAKRSITSTNLMKRYEVRKRKNKVTEINLDY